MSAVAVAAASDACILGLGYTNDTVESAEDDPQTRTQRERAACEHKVIYLQTATESQTCAALQTGQTLRHP